MIVPRIASITSIGSNPEPLVVGIDVGTESSRVGFFTLNGTIVGQSASAYSTFYPKSGHVEQNPEDWWACMGEASRRAIVENNIDVSRVQGMCVDTTACSVVLLNAAYQPIAPCILYCDARSAPQTKTIIDMGDGDEYLRVCNDGKGPISAEWMLPKCLWLKHEAPEVWNAAVFVCEKNDYVNYLLTGKLVASGRNVAARWNWDAEEATRPNATDLCGRPLSLLHKLGLEELLHKWPQKCIDMGCVIAPLSVRAATHLGLPHGIPVTQGGPDAYVGMIGLGCVRSGQMALITGSSHLHLCVGDINNRQTHPGVWGAYRGAPLRGLCFAEGGQSSTGSMIAWARRLLRGNADAMETAPSYRILDDEASKVDVGSDGLLCLETFQGSRTPKTDPLARGALVGLSLFHSRGHIWRSLLEAVCYGTRSCLEAMAEAGMTSNEIRMAGGATRSSLWLQMHADVVGVPIVVGECDNAPLLGSAVLAAVGSRLFSNVENAVAAMVRDGRQVLPNRLNFEKYSHSYRVYRRLTSVVESISHALASKDYLQDNEYLESITRKSTITVMPSILAADFSELGRECRICQEIGVKWIHVDVFDGSNVCTQSFSFGPSTVEAIHRACPQLLLDVHVATAHPESIIGPLVKAGASRITLQFEMFENISEASRMVAETAKLVPCGICIAPSTDIESIGELLLLKDNLGNRLVTAINVLAVTPGIGGMQLDGSVLEKVGRLRKKYGADICISVDGGINLNTAPQCIIAGADTVIAGTYLFGKNRCISTPDSMQTLRRKYLLLIRAVESVEVIARDD